MDLNEQEFILQAEMLSVLANPKRLMIITLLGNGERTVGEVAAELGISLQNASQHLRVMKDRGIVLYRKEGQTVYYQLSSHTLSQCCATVRKEMLTIAGNRTRLAGTLL